MKWWAMTASILAVAAMFTPMATAQTPTAVPGSAGAPPQTAAPMSWEGFMQDRSFDQFITINLKPQTDGSGGTFQVLGQVLPVSNVEWDGDRVTARVGSEGDNLVLEARRTPGWLSGELKMSDGSQVLVLREIPSYPAPRSRTEAWQQDLDVMTRRFAQLNRSLTPGERTLFIEKVEAIRASVDNLNDDQIAMRMAEALTVDDEPHTRLLLLRNATQLRRLPVRVWWFPDGLRIIRTTPEYRQLLGCRIDDFAKVPARQARELAGRAYAGNSSWRDYMTTYTLTSPEALRGAGITRDLEQVEVGLSDCRGAGRRTLRPQPLVKSDRTVESWWDLSPLRESPHGITEHVLGSNPRRLPPYLRNVAANYTVERIKGSDIVYLQFNRSQPDPKEKISVFTDRVLAEIARGKPRALVVDLRFNTGGDAGLSRELFRVINEHTASLPRYVITGRNTFSAGISSLAQMVSGPETKIVGELAGDDLDHWSEGGYVTLPNSTFEIDFQTVFHSYSSSPCPRDVACVDMNVDHIEPDVPVTVMWAEYLAGRDPALEAIAKDAATALR
jgi:hypothetical protein